MATKKKLANQSSDGWPKISQGTHLIVKTFEDGSTELVWNDDQLLKEVQEAIASVEQIESVTPKKKGKKNVSTQ
jgi:type IV secretory pathway VirD2 relaxase